MTTIDEDPRPKERFLWIEEARKVKPVTLEAPLSSDNAQNRSKSHARTAETGLDTYQGVWGETQIRHLLGRTLFGIKKSDLSLFKDLSLDQAVEQILTPSPAPPPPINDYEGFEDGAADPHVGLGESWLEAPHGGDKESYRIISLKTWLIKNMTQQEPTIHEKMIMFWNNLLVTKVWDVFIAKASYRYYEMLRNNALGNYKTLIKALTLDPSMLIFLNGAFNTKEAPDENYGRELQELFCIGKGPDSNYTEGDVQAAARVLTGWVIDWGPYENSGIYTSFFVPDRHDASDKQFSSFYNDKTITGRTGSEGANELDELLDMLMDNQETAKYICRRLYSFFVYSDISTAVEQNVITPMAEILRTNNYEITPVLKVLFKSEHFYDTTLQGVLIKSPADHLIGLWRTLGVQSPDDNDLTLNYEIRRSMLWHMATLGMEMADPPNVAGWPPYYQAPQYDKAWITTDTITNRAITTDSLLYWGFWISNTMVINADIIGFVETLENPSDPNDLLQEATTLLLGIDISTAARDNLKSILLSGQQNDNYWTIAWEDHIADPQDENNRMIVLTRLQATFRQLLQLGEYHLT